MPAASDTNDDHDPLDGRSERELAILRSAYRVMARSGGHRLNLQHIADEAGTSKGLILYHFGTKAEVLQQAMRWALVETARRIETALDTAVPAGATDALVPLLDAIFVSPQANRDFQLVYLDLIEHAARDASFAALPAMTRTIIEPLYAQVVRDGVARGEFHADDPDEAALVMRSVIDGTFLQWLQRPDWQATHAEFKGRCHRTLRALLT